MIPRTSTETVKTRGQSLGVVYGVLISGETKSLLFAVLQPMKRSHMLSRLYKLCVSAFLLLETVGTVCILGNLVMLQNCFHTKTSYSHRQSSSDSLLSSFASPVAQVNQRFIRRYHTSTTVLGMQDTVSEMTCQFGEWDFNDALL